MFIRRIISRLLPEVLRQRRIVREMPFRLVAAFGDQETFTAAQVRRVLRDMHLGPENDRFALALACSEKDYLDAQPRETGEDRLAVRKEVAERYNRLSQHFTMRQLSVKRWDEVAVIRTADDGRP